MPRNWKQVAWNGIRFSAPADWDVAKIDSRHLILERAAEPVMEVKWGFVKGAFSHKTHLKRLVASQSRKLKGRIAQWFLPPPWQQALKRFEASGFLWQSENGGGRGAILFCQACRNATLIQFLGESSARSEKVRLAVLKSFRDHCQEGRTLWSVFDIKAKLPEGLKLVRHRFEVGRYELVFSDGRQNVHLQRWAPAAAILSGHDLAWFSGTIPEFATGKPRTLILDDAKAIEWTVSPADDWRRITSRLKVKPSFFWYRLWHLTDKNRILGVRAESKRPLDFELLKRICAGYDSL